MSKYTPWNGDGFIDAEIKKLIDKFGIKTAIETGVWSAHTTRRLRELIPPPDQVIGIDFTDDHLIGEFGTNAIADLTAAGIRFIKGDSAVELPKLLYQVRHPILVYLDAHGGGRNPLKEEILALGKNKRSRGTCVIAVHDVIVPGKPWGYNTVDYGRGAEPLGMAVIEPWIKQVYPDGFSFHHNQEAAGCQRGIVYIYPKS